MDDLIPWGGPCPQQDAGALSSERARRLVAALVAQPAFDIIEFRFLEYGPLGRCDVVVAACTNQEVPNRNAVGIRVREMLAFTIPLDDKYAPEVRALRADFPVVPHLNGVPEDEPKSLCILVEEWSTARRTWTPHRFLTLTMWWLKETALERLHRPDQPVERVYFDGGLELVLPAGYSGQEPANTRLVLRHVSRGNRATLVAMDGADSALNQRRWVPVLLNVERVHGVLDWPPSTLGALVDQWVAHGVPLADRIISRVALLAGGGIVDLPDQAVVLILDIGVAREPGGPIERHEVAAFIIEQSVVSLAYQMGAVYRERRLYFSPSEPSSSAADTNADRWRPIKVTPMNAKMGLTRYGARRQAGINDVAGESADAARVLIGAGSLGSALAGIWAREGWGHWTFVDPDHVQPHNLVRHRAVYADIGRYKVEVLKELVDGVYAPSHVDSVAIPMKVTRTDDDALNAALETAEVIIDVSTSLDVPRALSARQHTPRMASAFMTPSGDASVLLLEDEDRTVPMHCIEPQYYRQILRTDWGASHLGGHHGRIAVGAGCRDVSMVMSPETVGLHAAILSRQIRILSARPEAVLAVWASSPDGSVTMSSTAVRANRRFESENWCVVLDDEIVERLRTMRAGRAPKETGGIIVGYTDHFSRTIYVVDVLPAPSDSVEEATAFERGVDGLQAAWKDVQERTGFIVNYIGEWHSHPRRSASPSSDDMMLIAQLGEILARDGEPLLMMIVAEDELSVSVHECDGSTTLTSAGRLT